MTREERAALMGLVIGWRESLGKINGDGRWLHTLSEARVIENCADELRALVAELDAKEGGDGLPGEG